MYKAEVKIRGDVDGRVRWEDIEPSFIAVAGETIRESIEIMNDLCSRIAEAEGGIVRFELLRETEKLEQGHYVIGRRQ